MKRWLLFLPVVLFGCPQFAPDDVCGYPGFCDGSVTADGGDSGKDGGAQCPSGKEPKDDPACVSETLGIFVAPSPTGNDSNAGTKSAPVATLKTALQKVGSKSFIFVCSGNYAESADVQQTVSIFGGFDCANWSYATTNLAKFNATKSDYVLHIDSANDVVIGDLELDALDAVPNTGQSSVGTFIANSKNVTLERLVVHAGKGADGVAGVLQSLSAQWPDAGSLQGSMTTSSTGGAANSELCPGGSGTTVGGKGGNGTTNVQFCNGDPGQPASVGGFAGDGGATCSNGGNGKLGDGGVQGASPTILGTVADGGWTPSFGGNGGTGLAGGGGGGGGGADTGSKQGGGGGGGAGGCGGGGGGGGSGGGGSIAVLTLDSVVSISGATLQCSAGGKGGNGVAGEAGQTPGGTGGVSTIFPPCYGGDGASGGSGGGGAGGAGGVVVGVLSKGGAVTIDTATSNNTTVPTQGGAKGSGASGNNGIDGVAQKALAL